MPSEAATEAAPALRPVANRWAERILACIDDGRAGTVIEDWLRTLPASSTREIVLVSLLPKPEEVRSRGILLDTVRRHLRDTGQQRLASILPAIQGARMRHRERVEFYSGAADIAAIAQEERADVIVMVGQSRGPLLRQIAAVLPCRSLAAAIADVSSIPVVILKPAATQ